MLAQQLVYQPCIATLAVLNPAASITVIRVSRYLVHLVAARMIIYIYIIYILQGVTAIAADPMSGYPPCLALALKSGKRVVRIMLYELLGGAATSLPRGATAMCTGQVEITEPLSIKVCPSRLVIQCST